MKLFQITEYIGFHGIACKLAKNKLPLGLREEIVWKFIWLFHKFTPVESQIYEL